MQQDMEKHLVDLQMERKLVVKEKDNKRIVYPAQFFYMELNTARMLHDLNIRDTVSKEQIKKRILEISADEQMELDALQEQAVIEAVTMGFLLLPEGPEPERPPRLIPSFGILRRMKWKFCWQPPQDVRQNE